MPFDPLTPQTLEPWLHNRQTISNTIEFTHSQDPANRESKAFWSTPHADYQAEFHGETLSWVQLRWSLESAPPAEEIVNCIGTPQSYNAFFFYRQFALQLHYPQQGIVTSGSTQTWFDQPPSDIRQIPQNDIKFTRPGNLETVLSDIFGNEEVVRTNLDRTYPWNGDWERIEYSE